MIVTRKQFLQTMFAAAIPGATPLELANEHFRVTVVAGPQGVWLDHFKPAGAADNFLFSSADQGILRSGFSIKRRSCLG